MTLRAFVGCLVLWLSAAGCDCGKERHHARAQEHDAKAETPAEPAPEPEQTPPPPSEAGHAALDPRFGTASLTFKIVDGQSHAEIRVTIPEGAAVQDGAEHRGAIYFDNGPPIAANLTAAGGMWKSADLRLPAAVRTATRAVVKIPTTPQTTFVWDVTGVWQNAEGGPVILETSR